MTAPPIKWSAAHAHVAPCLFPLPGTLSLRYGNLILERVASEAGYTRGALYHQFEDKEDLALAVLDWVRRTGCAKWAIRQSKSPIRSLS